MLFPQEDPEVWAQKYDLKIKHANCPKCKKEIVTDVPFAFKGYRGLKSRDHGCGGKYTRKILVPVSKEEIEYWTKIL
jgi:hypothetical protein